VARLQEAGFTAIAAVRNDEQAAALPAGAKSFRLDLSDPAQVDEAIAEIRSFGAPIRGLVNNAGMSRGGALEDLSMDAIREIFEINLFGAVHLTRSLLPDLRRDEGRVVNVGSGEGFLATPLNAPYCMAKHALEAFSESLRLELAPTSVRVSVVSPGQTETAILEAARADFRALPDRSSSHYQSLIVPRGRMAERPGMPPDRVARAVVRALTARSPRARYFVGSDSRGAFLLGRIAPAGLRRLFMRRVLGLQ